MDFRSLTDILARKSAYYDETIGTRRELTPLMELGGSSREPRLEFSMVVL
jgi:hypothetical protein